ncbi:hypothetical protein [Ascidiimonas sp. W6]|uniref:hypothetical protein n=1 Tax=Ascidiimonas meishanensis TaxID=3128903 RepID=UPI0030EE3478
MKNRKKVLLTIPLLLTFLIYSFTKSDFTPPVPESSISIEQAKLNRSNFIKNSNKEVTDVTFSYEQVKKFVELIEYKKSKGEDIEKIRVYMSQYENGTNTAFIAPIKKDNTPNYNIEVINKGNVDIPPLKY